MKRIFTLMLAGIIAFSFGVYSFEDAENSVGEQAGLLVALSVIDDSENMTSEITRGEFAHMIAKASGLFVSAGGETQSPFVDVTSENPYVQGVSVVKKMGYMSGYSDGTFHPERKITVNEAQVAIVNLLGYKPKANAYGGYPTGYDMVIRELRLRNGINSPYNAVLTKNDAVKLIYNAFHVETFKAIGIEGDSLKYATVTGETLLYDAFRIKTVTGIVNGVDITTLIGESELPPYSMYVGDTVIYAGAISVYEYIGCNVTAYYTEHQGRSFLRHIEKKKNEEIIIDIEDITEASGSYLKISDDNGKEIKYSFDTKAIIYNGVATDEKFNLDLLSVNGERMNGTIRLIDNDGNKKANVIAVDAYYDIIAGRIDSSKYIVYDKNDYSKRIQLDESHWEPAVKIYNHEGKEVKFSSINSQAVLSVYASKNIKGQKLVRAYISSDAVKGTLEEYSYDNKGMCIVVDGKSYILTKEAEKRFPNPILKKSVLLSLNIFGKVADISYTSPDGYNWALLQKAAYSNEFEATLRFKLMTSAGIFTTVDGAQKITIDGNEYKSTDIRALNLLKNASAKFIQDGSYCHQVIKYGVNAEGQINYIDTVLDENGNLQKQSESGGKNNLYMGIIDVGVHSKETGILAFKRVVSNPSTVFTYPSDDDYANDLAYYKIYSNSYFVSKAYRNLYYFGDSSDSLSSEVFLQMLDKKTGLDADIDKFDMSVVEKVTETTDAEGKRVRKLYLDNAGKKTTVLIDENAFHDNSTNTLLSYDYNDISAGDIIYYAESNGKIEVFQIRYDADKSEIPVEKGSSNGFYKGFIYSVKRDGIKFVITNNINNVEQKEANGEYRVFSQSKTAVYIVKKMSNNLYSVKQAETSELAGYDIAGPECSKVLVHIYEKSDYSQQTKTIYIYE